MSPYTAPSLSLSYLLLAGPLAGPLFGQSNVRPAPVVGRAPRADVEARAAEEASYLTLASSAVPSEAASAPSAPTWRADLELELSALSGAGLETGGERAVQRAGWSARLERVQGDRSLALLLDTEAAFYDWSSPVPLAAGSADPFNDVYRTSLGALVSFGRRAPVGFFTGAEVEISGEDRASPSDAISVGAIAGVDVHVSPELSLRLGLAALTRLEDETWVLPYLGFDWRATERLRLASEGARVLAELAVSDAWTVSAAAEYQLRQYRLNDDGPIPGGVLQDDQITLAGGLAWRFGERATLGLEAGMVAWQESRFLDGGGAELAEIETDPAPYALLRLSFGL